MVFSQTMKTQQLSVRRGSAIGFSTVDEDRFTKNHGRVPTSEAELSIYSVQCHIEKLQATKGGDHSSVR